MANIILPAVPVLNEIDDNAKLLIEQAGEINRYPISNLDVNIDIDTSLSTTSENPVQNKIITEAIDNIINNTADTIQTKTGEVITADNSAYAPMHGLKLYGRTTQNGTPSPDAPVPLDSVGDDGSVAVTVCGKNLINFANAVVANSESGFSHRRDVNLPAGDYIFTCENFTSPTGTKKGKIVWYDENDKEYYPSSFSQNAPAVRPITVTGTMKRFALYVDKDAGHSYTFVKPMLRLASVTADTYESYKGGSATISTPNGLPGIPVTSGGNYTDENGQQWICDEVDFEKGVYVQRVDKKNLSKMYCTYNGTAFTLTATGKKKGALNLLCSHWQVINAPSSSEFKFCKGADTAPNYIYVRDTQYTDVATLAAEQGDAVFMYELATPIETALSAEQLAAFAELHSNYPNTTVFNDEDAGMEVKYYTPNTAVPMAYGAAHSGKILSVDEHGCITSISPDFAGSIDIDLDDANEGEAHGINADSLGGYPANEYMRYTQNKAGFIYPLASEAVPEGFLLCDGAEYNRAEYPELFAAIGIIYGAGNGSTTFNVPNLQTRVLVGTGDGYVLGATGGEATHTLTVNEMPSHGHDVWLTTQTGNNGNYFKVSGSGSVDDAASTWKGGQTSVIGGSQPHNNMQPYTVVNYIIATGKNTGVSVADIIVGVQALPLGVEFGGTGATNIETARDNLGITPENIGALKSNALTWNLLGQAVGGTGIQLPECNECCISTTTWNGSSQTYYFNTICIPYTLTTANYRTYYLGDNDTYSVRINIKKGLITLTTSKIGTTDVLSSSSIEVFYR